MRVNKSNLPEARRFVEASILIKYFRTSIALYRGKNEAHVQSTCLLGRTRGFRRTFHKYYGMGSVQNSCTISRTPDTKGLN